MRVRMVRVVPQFVIVKDLEVGEVVDLTPAMAEQFIANEMAVAVSEEEAAELQAAAMKSPRRRG